ncbi:asparaginase [Billgrantia pellis]|uniref:Asparaginase n=1 Tax=Billgrantia pellis TaxID=2606936 RepID=A0A7V7KGD2_9GAMM|nr:asparaginase [Halomonas pellis]KAA0010266.1 asparaginase [Halomonas pellis]
MPQAKIVVLTTGGTIASSLDPSGRYRSGALSGEALMQHVQLPTGAGPLVEVRSILQKPSNAITLEDLLEIRRHCLVLVADPCVTGVVVTHGTDTLEETACFLDFTLPAHFPVVITGAQRAPHESGTDAYRNLADAVQVAGNKQAGGLGVVVVFNQSIFAARDVRKVSSFQLDGFAAPASGYVGYVDGCRVGIRQGPWRRGSYLNPEGPLPRVDIVPAYLDADAGLVESVLDGGTSGLVIDALGRGHVPPSWVDPIARACGAGVAVVVVSSCLRGPVHPTYEFSGSLADLASVGAIPVSDLSARKARLALALLLATPSQEDLASRFRTLTA